MAHSPFESWKRRSPSDRDEAHAAELIKKLGDAETLSPQAMHRVAHHLRSPERRHLSLFSDVRLAAASVGVLLLFVVGAWATVGYFDRQTQTAMMAAPRRPVQQTLARNDTPPPPEAPEAAPQAPSAPADGLRLAEPELFRGAKAERRQLLAKELDDQTTARESGFAQPPAGWSPDAPSRPLGARAMKKDKASEPRAEAQAELAMRDRATESPEALADRIRAAPAPAPAAVAPADSKAASGAGAAPMGMSVEGCKSSMPADAATLERNSGDVEQALFRHGVCLLLLSKREAGTADLRAYLARFPDGRFAEGVRALLVKSATQTPSR